MFGLAMFDTAGFFLGRTGCYRMVFSIPTGDEDGTSIFARNAETGALQMSDPVCVVNEDIIASVGEPSKLAAIGSPFSKKATFKVEYSLHDNNTGTGALMFKRRFWKRMNVEETHMMVHAKRTSRKIEPRLLKSLRRDNFSS